MKTLSAIVTVAVLGAFLFSPFRLELTVAVFAALGLGAIALFDYSRINRRIPLPVSTVKPISRKERFGLAA